MAAPAWQAEWPTDLPDPLDEDIALQKRIEASELWRQIRRALEETRERVFQTQPTTTEQLWQKEGAVGQLTYLLHHTPVLVVWQQRKDRETNHA